MLIGGIVSTLDKITCEICSDFVIWVSLTDTEVLLLPISPALKLKNNFLPTFFSFLQKWKVINGKKQSTKKLWSP